MDGDAVEQVNEASPYILRTRGLAKQYGSTVAVRDLNLQVRRGEVYGFLGPNGAGKTTSLLMLLGIVQPSGGAIEIFGQPGPIDPFRDKSRIGVVGEQQFLYDDLSAWEYLQLFGWLYGVGDFDQRATELLERTELIDFRHLRARDFSRGMQQKLGLARALLHGPELLILDEPVSGLDPHGIRQVREILAEENARGVTIIVSSHILSEVERTADRVGVLAGGRLVAEGAVASLSALLEPDPVVEVDIEVHAALDRELFSALPFVRAVEPLPTGVAITLADDEDHRRDIASAIASQGGLVTGIRHRRLSLEETFVRLTCESVGRLGDRLSVPTSELTPATSTAAPPTRPRSRARPATTLALHDARGALHSPAPYVIVALGVLAAVPLIAGYLDAVARERLLVLADPFTLPLFVATIIAMVYLSLASVTTIARERDQGTLEVLFYGPVDARTYILGKQLGLLMAFAPMATALLALIASYGGMTGLRLTTAFVATALLSLFAASAVAALGICISTLARGVRGAVAMFVGLVTVAVSARLGLEMVSALTVGSQSAALRWLRDAVISLDATIGHVSPFHAFQSGVDAATRGDWPAYASMIALMAVQTAVLLMGAERLLARRGVRK
jgi:ABC-2 type transport system ATP-binding protein